MEFMGGGEGTELVVAAHAVPACTSRHLPDYLLLTTVLLFIYLFIYLKFYDAVKVVSIHKSNRFGIKNWSVFLFIYLFLFFIFYFLFFRWVKFSTNFGLKNMILTCIKNFSWKKNYPNLQKLWRTIPNCLIFMKISSRYPKNVEGLWFSPSFISSTDLVCSQR